MQSPNVTIDRWTAIRLTAIGLFVAGLTLGALALVPAPATAEIAADSLTVADGHYAADGAAVYSPYLVVSGELEFAVDTTPDGWTVDLQVAPAGTGSYETLDTTAGGAISPDMALAFETRGALVDHSAFSSSDIEPGRNETVTHDVDVRLVLTVEDGGEPVVTANATDTATVTVENTLDELAASLDGDGYVLFWEDSADPEPTPTATAGA